MRYMIGIDVGSTNIKIYDGKKFKKYPIFKLNELLENYNNNDFLFATGYFRKKFKNNITEITAAIYGIYKKNVDIIIDVGGQDIKIIDTRTLEFIMNDKCGAEFANLDRYECRKKVVKMLFTILFDNPNLSPNALKSS